MTDAKKVAAACAQLKVVAAGMVEIDDLPALRRTLQQQVDNLEIPHDTLAMDLVVEANGVLLQHRLADTGLVPQLSALKAGQGPIEKIWRQGQTCYRPDLEADNPLGESPQDMHSGYGHPVRCVVDVPFVLGTISMNSRHPDSLRPWIPILEAMASAITEGLGRGVSHLQSGIVAYGLALRERFLHVIHRVKLLQPEEVSAQNMLQEIATSLVAADLLSVAYVIAIDPETRMVEGVAGCEIDAGGEATTQEIALSTQLRLEEDDPVVASLRCVTLVRSRAPSAVLSNVVAVGRVTVYLGNVQAGPLQLAYATVGDEGDEDACASRLRSLRQLLRHLSTTYLNMRRAESLRSQQWVQARAENLAHVGSWNWNLETGVIEWSDELYAICGRTRQQGPVPIDSYMGLVHPDDRERLAAAIERSRTEGLPYSVDFRLHRYSDGQLRHLQALGGVVVDAEGRPHQLVGAVQDVTEARQQAADLRASIRAQQRLAEQHQMAIDTAKLGLWRLKVATGEMEWNDRQFEIFGISPAEVPKDLNAWRDRVFPEDLASADREFAKVFEGQTIHGVEFRIRRSDGEIRYISASGTALRDSTGAVTELMGINLDATDLQVKEAELARSEAFLRAIFEHSLNAIVVADDAGNFLSANQATADLLGHPLDKLTTMNVAQLQAADARPTKRQYADYVESGRGTGEFRFIRPDGEPRVAEYHAVRIREDFNLSIMNDITDRERIEAERRRAQNLQSLGVLAGGIAHDFNNLLTGVSVNLSLLESQVEPGSEQEAMVKTSMEAIERTRGLSRQLLTFAKGGAPVREAASIEEVVRRATSQALTGSSSRAELLIEEDLAAVDADAGQIAQVVQNLVMNGDQAMPEGGVLQVDVRSVHLTEQDTVPLRPDHYVRVQVMDEGVGMPADVLSRIFDPYFTTKSAGHGLGLSVCHSIIEKHDGHITVDSTPGAGTTVTFYLPVADGETEPPAPTDDTSTQTGRILLMDDQEIILSSVGGALRSVGCQVVTTLDGERAVEAYQQSHADGDPFDVVILDLTVPGGMGGLEAMEHLRAIDPGVRAVIASGYAETPVLSRPTDYGFVASIEKPVILPDLLAVISKALNHGRQE